jgi:hypothetical protein
MPHLQEASGWRGGDVKNPGPVCKKCYHKKVWPDRMAMRHYHDDEMEFLRPSDADDHYDLDMDPDYDWRSIYGNNA